MKNILTCCLWIVLALPVHSQSMLFFADVMINADLPENRRLAAARFEAMFTDSLEKSISFETSLEPFKWLVVVYPADSSFRTVSWQIDMGNGKFAYRGLIQRPQGSPVYFKKGTGDLAMTARRKVEWAEWQGGIIYDIIRTDEQLYTLLTYRQIDTFTKLKTAELLNMRSDKWTLGLPLFQMEEGGTDFAERLVIEYSADSNVSLNYNENSRQLIFDNLIQVMGRLPGQGPAWVSDGSYKAYLLKEGRWHLVDKLYNEVLLTPPRSNRDNSKDLFGRPKNN